MLDLAIETMACDPPTLPLDGEPVVVGPSFQFSSRVSRKIWIRQGFALSERRAWSNMTLIVVGGKCDVVFEDHVHTVQAGEQIHIDSHVAHKVVAVSDVRAVVTFDALTDE